MIRSATANDFNAVYEIYMDESVNPFMGHDPMDREKFKEIFDAFLKRPYSWIYEKNGAVCGMCFAIKGGSRQEHVATISPFAVKTEYQAKGIGKEIMQQVITTLRKDGFRRIELMVEADNEKGISFYKKMGFQIDGRLPQYFRRSITPYDIDEYVLSITYPEMKNVA